MRLTDRPFWAEDGGRADADRERIRDELRGIASAMVDQSQVGLLALDAGGAVIEANTRGREALEAAGGLRERNGRLSAHLSRDRPALDLLLDTVLQGATKPSSCTSTTVGSWPDQRPLTIHVSPVAEETKGRCGVAALVIVVDPWTKAPVNPVRIARSLGLTPAEGCVVAALAEGMTICEIAQARNRSKGSVRQLVKHAFAKTWCSRQADLVRLALSVSRLPVPQHDGTD